MGKTGTGLLWLFTFGLLGWGQLIDLFLIGEQVETINSKIKINDLTAVAYSNAIEEGKK